MHWQNQTIRELWRRFVVIFLILSYCLRCRSEEEPVIVEQLFPLLGPLEAVEWLDTQEDWIQYALHLQHVINQYKINTPDYKEKARFSKGEGFAKLIQETPVVYSDYLLFRNEW